MPMPPRPKKKPAADISILMPEPGGDPKEQDDLGSSDSLDDSFGEDDMGDPDADLDMGDPTEDGEPDAIDPEQASLMADLGFSDPEQQQKLVQLIQLVMGPSAAPPPSTDSGTELPSEGGY